MNGAPRSLAPGRAVIALTGDGVHAFLDGLLTNAVPSDDQAVFGALLTPQGKILTDMIVHPAEDGVYLDTPEESAADLIKRLSLYRLRAKIGIENVGDALGVILDGSNGRPDPRHESLPNRAIGPRAGLESSDAYHKARIALGVPEAFQDYQPAEIFPADASMDWFHGVDLKKGCFVGQEVVSRMHRRGNIRKRMVPVQVAGGAPEFGAAVTAAGTPVGTIRSSFGEDAIALIRMDRLEKADGRVETEERAVNVVRRSGP